MAQFEVKPKDQQIWRVVYETETTIIDVNKVIDEKNRRYLSGKIRFLANLEYQYFYDKKQNGYKEIEIRYGETGNYIYGLISLIGEWNYRQKHCLLEIKSNDNYDEFEQLLDVENTSRFIYSNVFYDFDSYLDTKYCSMEIVSTIYPDYSVDVAEDFPTWDNTKPYVPAQIQESPPDTYYYGDDRSFVTYDSGGGVKKYACIKENTDISPTNTEYWTDITITASVLTYKQERALFEFDGSEYNEFELYWYKSGITTDNYIRAVSSYGIEEVLTQLRGLLDDTGFNLDEDWLNHAENINPRYRDVRIVNDETPETLTLSEVINHVEILFDCKWRLNGYYLTFKHWTELISEIKGAVPKEHDFEDRLNIQSFKGDDSGNVFEHRLNFSKSAGETHLDSVIDYDNEFVDSVKVKGNFDVDFVHAINKGGKNCPVTLDENGYVYRIDDLYNPDFVPSIIHENFYLVGREFETGELNGVETPLELNYSEQAEAEAGPELDFNVFDMTKNVKLAYGLGRFKSIEFNINDNKYKMTLAIQKPY